MREGEEREREEKGEGGIKGKTKRWRDKMGARDLIKPVLQSMDAIMYIP